ncbi:hypothetical protein FPZ49_29870 [Paenibacillus cremeus]|uniref:Uncharacterized protein n=1 Tax=Paenibacillus cremeus TaxID=2163881 RepID=A0A559K033_9BACL|nr:hypothetical protein FPZ49_29870 [Paenibacillus cremeus]
MFSKEKMVGKITLALEVIHPDKENIRKMRVSQMSGTGNHQYQKPKTQRMIQSVKDANSKPIIVNGNCLLKYF